MAKSSLNTQASDIGLLTLDSDEEQDSEEVMLPPWCSNLPNFQPEIIPIEYCNAPAEDQKFLETLQQTCEDLSVQLRKSTTLQPEVLKLRDQANFCSRKKGSEDLWIDFFVLPILNIALELSGMKPSVLILPLKTTTVGPSSLLPQWKGKSVSRKIDYGLVIKLEESIGDQIDTIPDQEECGIGPASSNLVLKNHPLFCHIEVKKQHQVIDPIVQLGVWTSAVYTRWEQVKNLRGSSRDLPISFGWTIEGYYWLFHVIRRLPDGSRRITENSRSYDTRFVPHIYSVIAMLFCLMDYGHKTFRKEFLDSVLNIQV